MRPILSPVMDYVPVEGGFRAVLRYISTDYICSTPLVELHQEVLTDPLGNKLTTPNGDYLITDRVFYAFSPCKAGDVVTFTLNTGVDPVIGDATPSGDIDTTTIVVNKNALAPYSFDLRVASFTAGVRGPVVKIQHIP